MLAIWFCFESIKGVTPEVTAVDGARYKETARVPRDFIVRDPGSSSSESVESRELVTELEEEEAVAEEAGGGGGNTSDELKNFGFDENCASGYSVTA
jgi:hypothetical protein